MNADDSARLRDLLANNRTLLAYIRTALSFSGLGFAVAKFGLSARTTHVSRLLGTFMVLVGLLVAIIGFVQHRAVARQVQPPLPGVSTREHVSQTAALAGCVLVCALLAIYIATSPT
jgi:putative membrane protein